MKECPNCGWERNRDDLRMCNCNEIICTDEQCKIDHLLVNHLSTRELEDEEYDELD